MAAAQQMAPPGGGLDRPTERPAEPFTSGLPTGPGPGPADTGGVNPVLDTLKAAYRIMQTDAIAALIEAADQ